MAKKEQFEIKNAVGCIVIITIVVRGEDQTDSRRVNVGVVRDVGLMSLTVPEGYLMIFKIVRISASSSRRGVTTVIITSVRSAIFAKAGKEQSGNKAAEFSGSEGEGGNLFN